MDTIRPYDRRDAARVFRERLMAVIERQGGSQAAFARQIGVDRSTLSQLLRDRAQLLSDRDGRLPRADTVAAIAQTCQVSADWLLGLSQQEQADDAIVGTPLEIATDAWDPAKQKLRTWHAEAADYKLRYVPTTLPDLLKTRKVNAFEYSTSQGMNPELAVRMTRDHLACSRRPETDMEICSSLHALEGFAAGEGIWRDLPTEARHQQLETIATLADELYPTVPWFLFDALERYAPPMTIFGPQRAVLYTGEVYFVFNSNDHIRPLTQHLDSLIRSAVVQPPEIPGLARQLPATMDE